MKKQIIRTILIVGLFLSARGIVLAADVNLTIRDGANIIYTSSIPLQPTGTIQIQGHDLDANSVLSVLNDADILSDSFTITDLQYYDSMGSFYLKCINSSCDNWQYTVNNSYPWESIDQKILSGGENIYVYFGPQNKVVLSPENINTNETLTVTAQKYDYENNTWTTRTGVTIGVTQPNPDDPWTPIEIQTGSVDGNGQAVFSSIPVGSYDVGIKEDFYFPTEALTVTEASSGEGGGGSSGGGSSSGSRSKKIEGSVLGAETKIKFDLEKAFEFLISQQKEDGSFGENLYTDWTALALASGNYQNQVIKLIKYFEESKIESALLTDYERRALALMSLGLNPYNTNGVNYIGKIISSFDGKQFGDPQENNDDVFALIVLQNAGFSADEKMLASSVDFILSAQGENGSWNESADMTGATIEAFSPFTLNLTVKDALIKAKDYLKQKQKDNGGWNDSASSTAWVIEGILAMNEKIEDWKKSENTPLDFLATMQDIDGGIKNDNVKNKLWETAYVASALSGKTWNEIMQKFNKHEEGVVVIEKKILPKKQTAKKIVEKTENLNTGPIPLPLNTTQPQPELEQKKGWFSRFWDSIFSVF